jgi:hypothetical protein
MGLKMKQKSEELILSESIEIPYFGGTVEIVGAIIEENRIESFKAKKNTSCFNIPNQEDKDFLHKCITAKIKSEYPEFFL